MYEVRRPVVGWGNRGTVEVRAKENRSSNHPSWVVDSARFLTVALIIAVVLAACTSPDRLAYTTIQNQADVPADPDPSLLPLAWFITQRADPTTGLLREATEALIDRCMTEHGFDYLNLGDNEADTAQPLRYWYGLNDITEARTDGYTGLDAAARAAFAAAEQSLSEAEAAQLVSPNPARREAYFLALYGREDDVVTRPLIDPITGEQVGKVGIEQGCRGEAQAEVFGGVESYLNYQQTQAWLQVAVLNIRQAAENVEPARDTGQLWLDCMSRAGFPPNHPFWPSEVAFVAEEMADFLGAIPAIGANWPVLPEPRPSPEEIKMAVADVTCKEESGWTMLVFTEEYRRQDELAAAAAEFIQQGQKIRAEAVERARTILGEG